MDLAFKFCTAIHRELAPLAKKCQRSFWQIMGNSANSRSRSSSGWSSVITSKAANSYHFKTGQRDWPSGTENVLLCRLLWWQVGFGAPAPRAALEHMAVVQ